MIRRRIPFTQIAFVTLIGVGGGVYIYRPYFVNNMKTPVEQNQNVPKKQSEPWLLIILRKSNAELYSGPSEPEAKLLRMWDTKFIECWLLNKQVLGLWLTPFLFYFFIVPYINVAQPFCQDASWTAPIEMFQLWRQDETPSAAAWPRKALPPQPRQLCTQIREIEGFLPVDVKLHKCA